MVLTYGIPMCFQAGYRNSNKTQKDVGRQLMLTCGRLQAIADLRLQGEREEGKFSREDAPSKTAVGLYSVLHWFVPCIL